MSETDFDTYKTTLLKRYAELICNDIITKEDNGDNSLLSVLDNVKKEYNIKFGIPVSTDTNNPETILPLEKFETMMQQAFASVEDDASLRTELANVKNFLDEHKGVLLQKGLQVSRSYSSLEVVARFIVMKQYNPFINESPIQAYLLT